jgi:hypothetical protein
MRQVIVEAAAQEHVVFHVFTGAFVAIKRMKFPSGEHQEPQSIHN